MLIFLPLHNLQQQYYRGLMQTWLLNQIKKFLVNRIHQTIKREHRFIISTCINRNCNPSKFRGFEIILLLKENTL